MENSVVAVVTFEAFRPASSFSVARKGVEEEAIGGAPPKKFVV